MARYQLPWTLRFAQSIWGFLSKFRAQGFALANGVLRCGIPMTIFHLILLLGFWKGIRACFLLTFSYGRYRIQIPGYLVPIPIDGSTSEPFTFLQVFVMQDFHPITELSAPKNIIDCGAFVGYTSIFMAHHFPDCRIIAVEAALSNFNRLKENTKLYPQVTPVYGALWSKKGVVKLLDKEADTWSYSVTESQGEGEDIPTVTVDQLMADYNMSIVDFLKIDIEGAEREVFIDPSWLPKVKALAIELHDHLFPGCGDNFHKATASIDFKCLYAGENLILVNQEDESDQQINSAI